VTFTTRNPEKSRDRTLSNGELKAIWSASEGDSDYSRIVRLCMLTGCRRDEIGGLRWSEITDDRLAIAAERMKASSPHEVALLPMIAESLPAKPENAAGCVFGRNGNGFSGWSKSKKAFDLKLARTNLQVSPWTLHDLRRTLSTRLHDAGVDPIVVEALLAHKQQGVAAVYNRATFRDAKRAALARWHVMLRDIVGQDAEPPTTCQ
jgi:integrase